MTHHFTAAISRLSVFLVLFSAFTARAELVEKIIEWEPACDGANICVITDGSTIQSVKAFALHSKITREWTIHYADGIPISAQYQERERERIKEGEHAGEFTGNNPIK